MIIYSKEPLNVMMKNILLLDDPITDGYVYVSKETYDQALSLNLTYNGDVSRVKGTISGKGMLNWSNNKAVNHAVNLCAERFTTPLNMLAPYLAYTVPIGIEWSEDNEEIAKMAYGILHQMSQFINFYATSLMPANAKADISLPKNIMLSYEDSWKAQIATLGECVIAVPIFVNGHTEQPMLEPVADQNAAKVALFAEQAKEVSAAEVDTGTVLEPETNGAVDTKGLQKSVESLEVDSTFKENEDKKESVEVPVDEEISDESKGNAGDVEVGTKESSEGSGDADEESEESDEDDMEAKILAMMKEIENAPAERFAPKDTEPKPEPTKTEVKPEPKTESVNSGESGTIGLTEAQIAEGNRRLLEDYDI